MIHAVAKEEKGGLYLDLIKAHRSVIIAGPAGGVVSSYRQTRKNATTVTLRHALRV
jgi:hypothetical protein